VQQLHLVGFTTDLQGLIFSARRGAKSGSFVVQLDQKLVETIAEAHRRRNGDGADGGPIEELLEGQAGERPRPSRPPRPDSLLTPREIQGRLRTGRTIEQVAREARVDTDWVDRWAAPVIAEQQKVVARARAMTFGKPRGGASVEPLGRSVAWSVANKGVWLAPEQFDLAWSAYQSLDSWIVRFRYKSRGRDHVAEWEVTGDDELVALDRTASQLAYLDRARRRKLPPRSQMVEATEPAVAPEAAPVAVAAAPAAPAARPRRTTRAKKGRARSTAKKRAVARTGATGGRATATRAGTTRSTAAKKRPAAKKRAARRPAAKRTATKAPAQKSAAKKAPARATAAKKSTAKKATTKRAVAKRATAKKATAKRAAKRSRRPPVELTAARSSRARQAATVMLSTQPDVASGPRFGTSGNPPAQRRSGAGGHRRVVRARGKKAGSATKAPPRTRAEADLEIAEADLAPETDEFAAVTEAPSPEAAPTPRPAPPAPRRRRQPRLRASVRRRDADDAGFDEGAALAEEGPAVVIVPKPDADEPRAQIAAERAGDLVDAADAADAGGASAGAEGDADATEATAAPETPARRRRFLRR